MWILQVNMTKTLKNKIERLEKKAEQLGKRADKHKVTYLKAKDKYEKAKANYENCILDLQSKCKHDYMPYGPHHSKCTKCGDYY
jgi:hypothetical protein